MSFRDGSASRRVSDPLNRRGDRHTHGTDVYAWPQIFAERFREVAIR